MMLSFFDYIRALSFIVVAVATSTRKCETWLLTDLIFSTVYDSTSLIFTIVGTRSNQSSLASAIPLTSITTQKLDPLHFALSRWICALVLATNVVWFLCYKSRDSTVIGSLLWSRVVGVSARVMVMIYAFSTGSSTFTKEFLIFGIIGNSSWLLGNIIQLVKSRPMLGRHEFKGRSSFIFRLCFLVLFVASITGLAFPESSLKASGVQIKVDRLHTHLYRDLHAFLLSGLFLMWYAPTFRNIYDKRAILCSQLTWMVLHFTLICIAMYDGILPQNFIPKAIGFCLVSSMVPVLGIYFLRKESTGKPELHITGRYNLRSSKEA